MNKSTQKLVLGRFGLDKSHCTYQICLHYTLSLQLIISWIYNYLCNQCLSPLNLQVRTQFIARCTRKQHYVIVRQWLAIGLWFSPVSSNKSDHHHLRKIHFLKACITEHLLSLGWVTDEGNICFAWLEIKTNAFSSETTE
jgi:hypothetical protein